MSSKGFSLTEILVAMTLMGLVILAVASVDITSRRFFGAAKDKAWIQDEAKIVMQHMIKNIQQGIGDMSDPGTPGTSVGSEGITWMPTPYNEQMLMIRRDFNNPPTPSDYTNDTWIGYALDARAGHEGELFLCPNTDYDHRAGQDGGESRHEIITRGVTDFTFITPYGGNPNQVYVTITVRRDPNENQSLDNPQTILTSTIILKAMSTR